MLDLLSLPFMQRALIAALISGLHSPAVGTYIVQRRLSLLGDGLGHVAIAGVGLAFLLNQAPLPVAVVVATTGAVIIELLRQTGRASSDVGLAILFYGGLATGLLFAGLAGQGAGTLSQYLFGSLTTVTETDLVVMSVLAVIVIVLSLGLGPQLFAVCADEEYARTKGLPIRALNLLIVIMAAVTVTMSMRTVGLLLVSALMVIPVATAVNIAPSFKSTMFTAMLIGALVAVGGTLASAALDTASGATIVVSAILVFLISWPVTGLVKALRRNPSTEDPVEIDEPVHHVIAEPHDSMDVSGRPAVLHGDHVDYLHDGHRHVPHGDHFDEH